MCVCVCYINNLLQFRHMYDLCLGKGKHDIYGFLDHQLIHPMNNKRVETQTYPPMP